MNLYPIQEAIRGEGSVSIPLLQKKLGVSYSEAKEILAEAGRRGWIQRECQGILYAVEEENLKLRYLTRREVGPLFSNLEKFQCLVLRRLADSGGITIEALVKYTRSEDRTREALDFLEKHQLANSFEDLWFSRVSAETARILSEVADELLLREFDDLVDGNKKKAAFLRKKLAPLFDSPK